ncbi:MAG: DUF1489 domain-containing protein [Pseudomonadota bacterium]
MLHLVKLSVGSGSVEGLRAYVDWRASQIGGGAAPARHVHTTRMVPKRREELLDGGSIYWVIKGQIQARQRLIDIDPFTDVDGVTRCHLVMEPQLIATQWQPKRPFQGWRYLKPEDAPHDLKEGEDSLSADMRGELAALGLL